MVMLEKNNIKKKPLFYFAYKLCDNLNANMCAVINYTLTDNA